MTKRIPFLLTLALFILGGTLVGQTIKVPNFAFSTHPFLVNEVSFLKNGFVIELTIENQSPTGYFCASRHIYLRNLKNNQKIYMTHSEGIPVCPNVYHFKWKGEKLTFKLFFPKIDTSIHYVDVIENCNDHCFSIFGLILDPKMNTLINNGYKAFENNDLQESFLDFKRAVEENPGYPYGFLYTNIIKVLAAQKNYAEAKNWYRKLQQRNCLDQTDIMEQISKENYFDKIK